MPGTKPTKREIAKMKVLSDIGLSPKAISKKLSRSHHTIGKYLKDAEALNDPIVKQLIEKIRETEASDLYLLGAKARHRLHELLDEGKSRIIETTALLDRSFQQRRLLEGQSTENIDIHAEQTRIVQIEARLAEIRRLQANGA